MFASMMATSVEADFVINSAGLFSDEVARMIDPESAYEIWPVRGEAAKFHSYSRPGLFMTGMNVYPAPYGYWNETGEKAEVSLSEFHRLVSGEKSQKQSEFISHLPLIMLTGKLQQAEQ